MSRATSVTYVVIDRDAREGATSARRWKKIQTPWMLMLSESKSWLSWTSKKNKRLRDTVSYATAKNISKNIVLQVRSEKTHRKCLMQCR